MTTKTIRIFLPLLSALLSACDSSSDGSNTARAEYSVGGTVSGLSGTLILTNNGEEQVLTENGLFRFSTLLRNHADYAVAVSTNPAGQSCTVQAGSGRIDLGNVTNISVTCVPDGFTVGGSITGLAAGRELVLGNGSEDELSIAMNGLFTFLVGLANGAEYDARIITQPHDQHCVLSNGTGTITGIDVTGLLVACRSTYSLSGTITGLTGSIKLGLRYWGHKTITEDGTFTFPDAVSVLLPYEIYIRENPTNLDCTIENGTGTGPFDIVDITITCTTLPPYTVSGTVSGLDGTLRLLLNNIDELAITANGSFDFPSTLGGGEYFSVTAFNAPPDQDCAITGGEGYGGYSDVTDVAVNCMPGVAGTWGQAARIETGSPNGAALFAVNAAGNAFAVWRQPESTHDAIYAARYVAGNGWQHAERIDDLEHDAEAPTVAVDANGNAIAIWLQRVEDPDPSNDYIGIYASRYAAGSGWQSPILLSNFPGIALMPQLAMNTDGSAVVVWHQALFNNSKIYAAYYLGGSGWQEAIAIGTDYPAGYPADIAIDSDGNAIAVFLDDINREIYANHYDVGSGWQGPEPVSTSNSFGPRVEMDGFGNALVAWAQQGSYGIASTKVYARRHVAGIGWSSITALDTANLGHSMNIDMAVNSDGDAIVLWDRFDLTDSAFNYALEVNRYIAGDGWQGKELLSAPAYGSLAADVTLDTNGNIMAAWRRHNGSLFARRLPAGGAWEDAVILAGPTEDNFYVQLGNDGLGNVFALWRQRIGPTNNVFFNRYRNN